LFDLETSYAECRQMQRRRSKLFKNACKHIDVEHKCMELLSYEGCLCLQIRDQKYGEAVQSLANIVQTYNKVSTRHRLK